MSHTPPRLHVIQATGCDKALVLRRGPSDHVACLLWDRRTGQFEMGQWLKGRIYEHRCDLSPDARYFVYFAGTGLRWWTAVSRAPWLRAMAICPQDSAWHGGGAFDAEGRLWLNAVCFAGQSLPDGLKRSEPTAFPHATDGFHLGDLYVSKMKLRGWRHERANAYDAVMTKDLADGWQLELRFQLMQRNRSAISNSYALVNPSKSLCLDQPQWEWADTFDGVLQVAQMGCLQGFKLSDAGMPLLQRTIRDFSTMSFEVIKAPYEGVSLQEYSL